jgi:hypothetical protein
MKKLYLFVLILHFVFGYSQNNLQNSNWIFGDRCYLNFAANGAIPITEPNLTMNQREGCATLSDPITGELLFYTNGIQVWNKLHIPMIGGEDVLLFGNSYTSQSATIVPKPLTPDHYYIITKDGEYGNQKGMHYTEIDLSLNSGLGGIVLGKKNIPFNNHLGDAMSSTNTNFVGQNLASPTWRKSERVTTAKNCNGQDYWIISDANNMIYTYEVTASGINVTPSVSYQYATNLTLGKGTMKMSPYNNKLALSINHTYDPDAVIQEPVGIFFFDFDSSNGNFTSQYLYALPPPSFSTLGQKYYSVEFSPNNVLFYFGADTFIFQDFALKSSKSQSFATFSQKIWQVDITKKSESIVFQKDIPLTQTQYNAAVGIFQGIHSDIRPFQLAKDGKIYTTLFYSNPNSQTSYITKLARINAPENNGLACDFQEDVFDFGTSFVRNGLPAKVLTQTNLSTFCQDCLTGIALFESESNQYKFYKAFNTIYATNGYSVSGDQRVTLQAGDYVSIEPNTSFQTTTQFNVQIATCFRNPIFGEKSENDGRNLKSKSISGFMIYPNPSNNDITISMNNSKFNNIIISSIDGKVVFENNVDFTSEYHLDINDFSNGIYIINVTDESGKQFSEKLIKN